MPLYNYRCPECDVIHEILKGISETKDIICEDCGTTMNRIYSPTGIIFKGSGFYKTDYRSNGAKSESGGSKSGSSSSTNSSSKTAAPGTDKPTSEKKDSCPASGTCGKNC